MIYFTIGYTPGTEASPPTRPAGIALVDRDTPRTNADNCILQFVNSFFSSSSVPFLPSILNSFAHPDAQILQRETGYQLLLASHCSFKVKKNNKETYI